MELRTLFFPFSSLTDDLWAYFSAFQFVPSASQILDMDNLQMLSRALSVRCIAVGGRVVQKRF